ncbi:MAG: histidine phosphatase family protein [Eubacteriales bacterium]|nr:histidine phosphatase family protein [Eubacteriales bacterium]
MPACLSPYESCPILPDHRIIEINFGRWEGLGCGEHNLEIPPEEFSLFFTTPEQLRMPEGAENVTDVIARTGSFLSDLSGRKELSDKTILVTLHGCAMRALLHPLYPEGSGFWQERCPPQL